MRNDVYQIVTDRIMALLESGTIPWRKPWKGGEPPQNLVSRKPYRGINIFLLNAARFGSPFWLSFKQVQGIGAMVRKGEKAFPVVFWKQFDIEDNGKTEEVPQKRAPLLRYYNVFNIEQCENVKPHLLPKPETNEFQPIDRCDQVVAGMPKWPKIVHGGARAMYCPVKDTVTMPNTVSFDSPEFYYSTLFHELSAPKARNTSAASAAIKSPSWTWRRSSRTK